ncbi:MAG: hypothetical protein TREMPRED_000012 [Tremellales sp. Tagirdzhanova-0007]|nr:MAG: hypothetical protein TREMPRED_000012 [Tremellales sp. Tagirdzhanova-0007]
MSVLLRPLRTPISTLIPRHIRHPLLRAEVVGSSRCYATQMPQPMRDMMTGEIIQLPDIDASHSSLLKIEKTTSPKPRLAPSKLIFGRTFTDHMLVIPWNSAGGWGTPNIKPYGPFLMDPSSSVLHYAFTLFEGMKAHRQEDGTVRLFRPDMNMRHLIKKLVVLDSEWIPKDPGYSLYIRPTLIGTQNVLGVGPSSEALLFVICSPVGPYYASGFKPVSLMATTKYVRAGPGGTGCFKIGANYGPSVVPQVEAAKEGYGQILWLLGEDHTLTEVGTMNLFVAFKKPDGTVELVTPPLDDVILPGVVRDSVLALGRAHENGQRIPGLPEKLQVSERKMIMAELVEAQKDSRLLEVFGTGTAAVVSAIDKIGYEKGDIAIPTGPEGMGQITKGMLDRLTGIQTGEIEHEWSVIANDVKTA